MGDQLTDAAVDSIQAQHATCGQHECSPDCIAVRTLVAALREARAENTALGVRIQEAWARGDRLDIAHASTSSERDDLRSRLIDAAAALRQHADVCSRHGEPDRLREAADALDGREAGR